MVKVLAALYIASIAAAARAFAPPPAARSLARRTPMIALAAGPLDNLFGFLKEGKVGLVKSIAGEYDSVAIRAKIDSLVESNPVLMLSFTT